MNIPIYVNSFNRLTWLRGMLPHLARMRGAGQIYVVDNASTYPPLVDWLAAPDHHTTVIQRGYNDGPRGAFNAVHTRADYFVICDPDLDLSNCPDDTLMQLKAGLAAHPVVHKVGLGIRLDDIPEAYPWRDNVLHTERGHWDNPAGGDWYNAPIDTHFALCRNGAGFAYGPAMRLAGPYQCRHLPWYATPATITDEELWYIDNLPKRHQGGLTWSGLHQAERSKLVSN